MESMSSPRSIYYFGCHVLDVNRALLAGPGGHEIQLRPKTFDVLRYLVENAGRVVARGELLDAVWPGLHISDDGLTQCVREARRALRDETQELIRTVAKRGYMLMANVVPPDEEAPREDANNQPMERKPRAIAASPDLSVAGAPRLSLVVLPFTNLSGDPEEDYLSDAVTDDLTTDLSRLDGAFVVGRGSAQTYRGRAVDARRIGPELGVRYVVHGTVRRIGANYVRINADLVSTENGANLWCDRFDQDLRDLAEGQSDIVWRLGSALGVQLVDVESERVQRERPLDPDAFDLVLRARVLHVFSRAKAREAQAMLERALALSPDSLHATVALAYSLMNQNDWLEQWDRQRTERALELLRSAEKLRPSSVEVIALRGAMLLWQGRYLEGSDVYQRVLTLDANFIDAYHQIGAAKLWTRDPEGALVYYRQALRRDPVGPGVSFRYAVIGYALLLAKRPSEAAEWLRRAVRENPARDEPSACRVRAFLASALALSGELREAATEVVEVARLAPTWTARSWDMRQWRRSDLGEQLRYASEGLRLAGLRDIVDEDHDTGLPATAELHDGEPGPTPMHAPGVTTLSTSELQCLLEREQPILLDVHTIELTIPGALVVQFDASGSLDDRVQDKLHRFLGGLTGEDPTRGLVVFGWNAERWDARNIAIQLAALGYQRVFWYRGGKESWLARGLATEVAQVQCL